MSRFRLSAVGVAVMLATAASAAGPAPPRETRSDNGRFLLRVNPGHPGRGGQSCQATLVERTEHGGAERKVWERALVNEISPAQVFVRDDGQFVVTLDELRRGGARNAVVIYGAQGELLRHFLLIDLLKRNDWPHVAASRREVVWLAGARAAFDTAANQFVIELGWGRSIRLDLKTLRVVGEPGGGDDELSDIPAAVLAQLFEQPEAVGSQPDRRPSGLTKLTPEEQAQTAAIARQLSGDGEKPTTLPVGPTATAPTETADVAETAPEPAPSEAPVPAPAAVSVPQPNAADKVDFVAWLNRMGRLDGPDARPLYDTATRQLTPWVGSADLLAAAARGDPAALASPELAPWLDANAGALATFHKAAQYPAKGWHFESTDGAALSVTFPSLTPIRTLARATVVQGRQLAATGQGGEAAERYLDVLAAGAHTGSGLTLVENLVGMAMQAPAAEALLDLEASPAGATLDYAALSRDAEAAYQPTRAAVDAIQGERAFFMDSVQRVWDVDPQTGACTFNRAKADELLSLVEDGNADPAGRQRDLDRVKEIGFEQTVALGAAYYEAMTAAMALPYPHAHPRVAEIEKLLDDEEAHPLLRRLTPSLERYGFLKGRGEATRAATLLVTHLHAYRQEHGEYPASLDVFAGQNYAVDPFSGAPFIYRRRGDDFVLYSVGGNGVNDAGVHDRKGETNDLVFWPRPK
jgi:hypothetical protein